MIITVIKNTIDYNHYYKINDSTFMHLKCMHLEIKTNNYIFNDILINLKNIKLSWYKC